MSRQLPRRTITPLGGSGTGSTDHQPFTGVAIRGGRDRDERRPGRASRFTAIAPIVSFTVNNVALGGMLAPTLELIPIGAAASGSVTLTTTNTSATLSATGLTPGGGYVLRVSRQGQRVRQPRAVHDHRQHRHVRHAERRRAEDQRVRHGQRPDDQLPLGHRQHRPAGRRIRRVGGPAVPAVAGERDPGESSARTSTTTRSTSSVSSAA